MKHRILFGTTNPSKIEIIKAFLEKLPVEIVSPADLNIYLTVSEDGESPEENAGLKSRAYFAAVQIPTLAIDASLTIQDFAPDRQPGVYVRRIFGAGQEVSDRQMLEYYMREIDAIGGESRALWTVATAFTISAEITYIDTFYFDAPIVSHPSQLLLPGVPLSSLMIDPRHGKYFSEIDHRQRADAEWVKAIMQKNLERWEKLSGYGNQKFASLDS